MKRLKGPGAEDARAEGAGRSSSTSTTTCATGACCRWSRWCSWRSSPSRSCSAAARKKRRRPAPRGRRPPRTRRRHVGRLTVVEAKPGPARLPQAPAQPRADRPVQAALHRPELEGAKLSWSRGRRLGSGSAEAVTSTGTTTVDDGDASSRPRLAGSSGGGAAAERRPSGGTASRTSAFYAFAIDVQIIRTATASADGAQADERAGRSAARVPAARAAARREAPVVTYMGISSEDTESAVPRLRRGHVGLRRSQVRLRRRAPASCSKSSRASR